MPTPRAAAFEPISDWQRAREPIFWLDPSLKLTWVNRAWEELTGYPARSVLGLTCQAHGPGRAGDMTDLAASFYPPPESLAGQPAGSATLIYSAGGERLSRRVEFWPFSAPHNGLIGLLGVVRPAEVPASVPESEGHRLRVELLEIRRALQEQYGLDGLIGTGPAHRRLLEQVRLAAASSVPVLVVGERGTGKRQVARAIHQYGPGSQRPLVAFDCEALPAEILERELFGASDADAPRASPPAGLKRPRLSLLDGSTLLIRDIQYLPRDLQVRLVDALDSGIRLLATSTLDPEAALRDERLRPELYFALTALVVRLDPLRERREELPVLAQHVLERVNQRGGSQRGGYSPEAIAVLLAYDWPGNLGELVRVVEYAHARGRGEGQLIVPEDLPATIRGSLGSAYCPPSAPRPIKPLDELLTEIERRLIETALRQARSNKSRAADLLGISRPRLYRRMKELNLPDGEPAEGDEPAPELDRGTT
jgi:DNA-binding NtrC family response regulator